MRSDARKRLDEAHHIHPDPAVRELVARERRAAAAEAFREYADEIRDLGPFSTGIAAMLRARADRIAVDSA